MKYCPNCGSNHIHKSGKTKKGSQRYYCYHCGERHIEEPKLIFDNPKQIKCIHCGSTEITKKGHTRNGNQRYFCKKCNRKFAIYEPSETLTLEEKKLIIKYHFYCGVSILNLAQNLHHSQSTITKFIKEVEAKKGI